MSWDSALNPTDGGLRLPQFLLQQGDILHGHPQVVGLGQSLLVRVGEVEGVTASPALQSDFDAFACILGYEYRHVACHFVAERHDFPMHAPIVKSVVERAVGVDAVGRGIGVVHRGFHASVVQGVVGGEVAYQVEVRVVVHVGSQVGAVHVRLNAQCPVHVVTCVLVRFVLLIAEQPLDGIRLVLFDGQQAVAVGHRAEVFPQRDSVVQSLGLSAGIYHAGIQQVNAVQFQAGGLEGTVVQQCLYVAESAGDILFRPLAFQVARGEHERGQQGECEETFHGDTASRPVRSKSFTAGWKDWSTRFFPCRETSGAIATRS